MKSFNNHILRVNLTDGTTLIKEFGVDYIRQYPGGWNMILDILLKEVPSGGVLVTYRLIQN